MEWFENLLSLAIDWDSDQPLGSRAIALAADRTLGGETMVQFVRSFFRSQKAFGEFIGVGESTVAGWMKSEIFPEYAKRAALSAFLANRLSFRAAKGRKDAARPKVVADGDRYLVVRFDTDEVGVAIGTIIARDIPTEKDALAMAGIERTWDLVQRAKALIEHAIEFMDPEHSEWIRSLKADIDLEQGRTFDHEGRLKFARQSDLDIDLSDITPEDPTDDAGGEAQS